MVPDPVYLTYDEVVALHDAALIRYGGAPGVRDVAALESALAQPMMAVFGHERFCTLAEKAAAYCFFIARNHPFVDGNKRAGLLGALHFLLKNGTLPTFDRVCAYEVIRGVAAGELEMPAMVSLFQHAELT